MFNVNINYFTNKCYYANLRNNMHTLLRTNVETFKRGVTALISAAFKGHVDIARMLVDKGANLDLHNTVGITYYN
jgi:ankyrin repeat protein